LTARGRRGRTLILAYHNIIPDSSPPLGDRSLHLRQAAFDRQLDVLVEHCDVVALSSVLVDPPESGRPRVVITFDDAYHGALTLGAAALRSRGLPATVFVPPGMLGRDSFWWDAFAEPDGLSAAFRAEALGSCQGDDEQVRAWALRQGFSSHQLPAWFRPGTESALQDWVASGLRVASHSWRHANLTGLATADVVNEVNRPLEWLCDHFGNAVESWLTYPYGFATAATLERVREAGYDGALLVGGGWVPRPLTDRWAVPRLNIGAGMSIRGFYLRISGVFQSAVAAMQQARNGTDTLAR
jgi:peptidoglycan/xylan/chitin deacetylase (PgdA/CDA1 family)